MSALLPLPHSVCQPSHSGAAGCDRFVHHWSVYRSTSFLASEGACAVVLPTVEACDPMTVISIGGYCEAASEQEAEDDSDNQAAPALDEALWMHCYRVGHPTSNATLSIDLDCKSNCHVTSLYVVVSPSNCCALDSAAPGVQSAAVPVDPREGHTCSLLATDDSRSITSASSLTGYMIIAGGLSLREYVPLSSVLAVPLRPLLHTAAPQKPQNSECSSGMIAAECVPPCACFVSVPPLSILGGGTDANATCLVAVRSDPFVPRAGHAMCSVGSDIFGLHGISMLFLGGNRSSIAGDVDATSRQHDLFTASLSLVGFFEQACTGERTKKHLCMTCINLHAHFESDLSEGVMHWPIHHPGNRIHASVAVPYARYPDSPSRSSLCDSGADGARVWSLPQSMVVVAVGGCVRDDAFGDDNAVGLEELVVTAVYSFSPGKNESVLSVTSTPWRVVTLFPLCPPCVRANNDAVRSPHGFGGCNSSGAPTRRHCVQCNVLCTSPAPRSGGRLVGLPTTIIQGESSTLSRTILASVPASVLLCGGANEFHRTNCHEGDMYVHPHAPYDPALYMFTWSPLRALLSTQAATLPENQLFVTVVQLPCAYAGGREHSAAAFRVHDDVNNEASLLVPARGCCGPYGRYLPAVAATPSPVFAGGRDPAAEAGRSQGYLSHCSVQDGWPGPTLGEESVAATPPSAATLAAVLLGGQRRHPPSSEDGVYVLKLTM